MRAIDISFVEHFYRFFSVFIIRYSGNNGCFHIFSFFYVQQIEQHIYPITRYVITIVKIRIIINAYITCCCKFHHITLTFFL